MKKVIVQLMIEVDINEDDFFIDENCDYRQKYVPKNMDTITKIVSKIENDKIRSFHVFDMNNYKQIII